MEVNTDEVAVWQDGDSDVLQENHQGQDNEASAELCDDNSSTLDCDDQQVDIADTGHTCTSTKSDIGINTRFQLGIMVYYARDYQISTRNNYHVVC